MYTSYGNSPFLFKQKKTKGSGWKVQWQLQLITTGGHYQVPLDSSNKIRNTWFSHEYVESTNPENGNFLSAAWSEKCKFI